MRRGLLAAGAMMFAVLLCASGALAQTQTEVILDPLDHDNGKWQLNQWVTFENGALHLHASRVVWAYSFTDGSVRIDTEHVSGPLNKGYGLGFRLKIRGSDQAVSGYQLWIAANNGWKLVKRADGAFTDLTSWAPSDALHTGEGATNRIAVVCVGDGMLVMINDQLVGGAHDGTYTDGGVGPISTDDMDIAFRNLRIECATGAGAQN